jgi:hypothetical protein
MRSTSVDDYIFMHDGLHSHMLTAVYPGEPCKTIARASQGVHVTWNQAHKSGL